MAAHLTSSSCVNPSLAGVQHTCFQGTSLQLSRKRASVKNLVIRSAMYKKDVEMPLNPDFRAFAEILNSSMAQFDAEIILPRIEEGFYPMPRLVFLVLSPEFYFQRDSKATLCMWLRSVHQGAFVRDFFLSNGVREEILAAGTMLTSLNITPGVNSRRRLSDDYKPVIERQLRPVIEDLNVFNPEHFINRLDPGKALLSFVMKNRATEKEQAVFKFCRAENAINSSSSALDLVSDYFIPQGEEYLKRIYGGEWRLAGVCFPLLKDVPAGASLLCVLVDGEPVWEPTLVRPLSPEARLSSWPLVRGGDRLSDYVCCDRILQHDVWKLLVRGSGEFVPTKLTRACSFWKRIVSDPLFTTPGLTKLTKAEEQKIPSALILQNSSGTGVCTMSLSEESITPEVENFWLAKVLETGYLPRVFGILSDAFCTTPGSSKLTKVEEMKMIFHNSSETGVCSVSSSEESILPKVEYNWPANVMETGPLPGPFGNFAVDASTGEKREQTIKFVILLLASYILLTVVQQEHFKTHCKPVNEHSEISAKWKRTVMYKNMCPELFRTLGYITALAFPEQHGEELCKHAKIATKPFDKYAFA